MKIFRKLQAFILILLLNSSVIQVFAASQDYTPVRSGISAEANQSIGNSIQFNRYHDQPHLPQIRGHLSWSITGNARYAAIRAQGLTNLDDERDFVTAALDTGGGPSVARVYTHTLNGLNNGNIIRVFTYVHNNAIQSCGGGNYARNTSVTLDWNDPRNLVSSISASNSIPRTINDTVDLGYNGNYTLQYIRSTDAYRVRPDDYPIGHPLYLTCPGSGSNTNWSSRNAVATNIGANRIRINLGDIAGSSGNSRILVSYFRIVSANPSIQIDKDDSTPGTVDSDGNDTQTINLGGTANFTIKVTNNGDVGLNNVSVTDALAPNCNLSVAQALPKITAIGNNNNIFDPNEEFTYTCTDTNVTVGYINTANTRGISVSDNITVVTDTDPTVIVLNTNPSIDIDKDDSTPGTSDTDGNDTQTVITGGTANFTIKVTNNGDVGLNNVSVTDALAPNCNLSVAQALVKIQAIGNNDNIFNPSENFTYTCTDTNVTAGYTNTAITNGNSVIDNTAVTDNDPTVIVLGNPSIDIDKDDSTPGTADTDGNDTQTVNLNGTATFTIKVTNNGTVGLENVLVTDVLEPTCALTIPQALLKITAIGNNNNIFDPNESFTYICQDTGITAGYTNTAATQGRSIIDNSTLVNDNDPTIVVLNTNPSIQIDKDDSTPGTSDIDGNDTQSLATGGTANFTIKVTNNGDVGLNNVSVTDALAPNCNLSVAQALVNIQGIGNNDNIFDSGENFTYTCTDTNVTASYTNTAITNGNSVVNNQAVADNDPTIIVILGNPSINIDKDDSTPGTADTDGNDTQTVMIGGVANFTIKVTNDGAIGLENVLVNDVLEPSCALTIAQALVKIQAIGNNDNIFDSSENFTYTCTDTNVTAAYTNTATTQGRSVLDNTTLVNDDDPTIIVLDTAPNIQIDKDDSTPGTSDIDGNDTQAVATGGTATFTIKVTNNGNVGLNNVSVTDALAPSCNLSVAQALVKIQAIGNNDNIFDPSENFTYTCTDTNVTTGYTNTAVTNGNSVIDNTAVTDNDPTIIVLNDPSINIDKDDSTPGTADIDGNDTQTIIVGADANFTIKVTNDGNVGLNNVSVTDALAPNCNLSVAQALVKIQAIGNNDNIFDPSENFTYTCIDTNVTAGYTNTAITEGRSIVDNTTIVNDNDPTVIIVQHNPSINIDKDDSTPGTADTDGNDSQTIISGGNAEFTITVTNNGNVGLETVSVTDVLAPSCALDVAAALVKIQAIGNNDNIFNPAESFTYTCTDTNVTAGYVNTVTTVGTSVVDHTTVVNADDPTTILVQTNPSIQIDKDDSTPGTADTDGNDTQTVATAGTATFTITVTNNGNVGLETVSVTDALAPSCSLDVAAALVKIQVIGNNDNIFNPAESFTYTCTDTNVTASYTNIASTTGTSIVDHTTLVNDEDPTEIVLGTPSINIDKDDSTPGTADTDGNDTQTVATGGTANFTIKVTNDGQVGLTEVLVTDALNPACELTGVQSNAKIQLIGNLDNILDPTESFTYTCTDTNVTASYTNTASTDGISVIDNTTHVTDADTTNIIVGGGSTPSIKIDKNDNDNTDDTQQVNAGGTATFKIIVTNDGTVGLENVSVTDALAPSCDLDAAATLVKIQLIGNLDNILDPAETFTYTCTQTNVTSAFTNTATTTGTPVGGGTNVTDTDTTVVTLPGSGGGGGGSAPISTNVPVCQRSDQTGAFQCRNLGIGYLNSTDRSEFNRCRGNDYNTEEFREARENFSGTADEKCLQFIFGKQGLDSCSTDSQCSVTVSVPPVPTNPTSTSVPCVNVTRDNCPACIKTDVHINKSIKDGKQSVAKGDKVTFKISVSQIKINQPDIINIKSGTAVLRVYDMTIPSESGNIWLTEGIQEVSSSENFVTQGWSFHREGPKSFFEKSLSNSEIDKLEQPNGLNISFEYQMDTGLALTKDSSQIKNVAFAVIRYEYQEKTTDVDGHSIWVNASTGKRIGIGTNVCENSPGLQTIQEVFGASAGSYGSTATIKIIRPFVQAKIGNIAINTVQKENISHTGKTKSFGGSFLTNNGSPFSSSDIISADDFKELSEYQQAETNNFYENLNQNAGREVSFNGQTFNTHENKSNVYFINSDVTLNQDFINDINVNSTFILKDGVNLYISEDINLIDEYFSAFIVRTGNIIIHPDVENIEGVFIAEQGKILSGERDLLISGSYKELISKNVLNISGNIMGNLAQLLSSRLYIGTDPSEPKASINVEFDNRILTNTPPILEQFLGENWREEI